ncbi:UNVERIFIED_CONTAM: hypothetical protein GTU68_053103 [Idotea baltica]|nr:hypothetical protein [Idotea baltica]
MVLFTVLVDLRFWRLVGPFVTGREAVQLVKL